MAVNLFQNTMAIECMHKKAAELRDFVVSIRRHLHQHPELSYQEYQTATYVEHALHQLGIGTQRMAQTGIVGIIKGKNPQARTVALRADMDALPIAEANDVPYKSQHPGVMHACGHDAHTAILLGAARLLQENREHWTGTIKLIFQPGEEKNPGGASIMIADGVLENPTPQCIAALHVHPGLPTGKFSFRSGTVMASADELYFTIKSKGGHAAAPHLTGDTILASAHLVISLQQIISRNNHPFNPSVLSIASIQGGHTTNVIPSEVKMMGTLRCMNETWRREAHDLIRRHTQHLAQAFGVEMEVHIDVGYPAVLNDALLTEQARELAIQYAGRDHVEETEMRMGAEDFGYYAQQIPACFFRLGVMNASKGITGGVHTPTFDVDEDALVHGAGMMAWLGMHLNRPTPE
jgi:hippurate hydrolase